ncbi:MAG: DUF1223 domain-containing protein [Terriglobales bacterium]
MRSKTCLMVGLWAVLCAPVLAADNAQSSTPVLVELFTSEGCSSCPPADKMLANLDRLQPVAGAHVIVIEEHVDYWNHDGWVDKYSSSGLTERQTAYKERFKINDVYTPQMVVDGATQFLGSDPKAALRAIEEARGKTKVGVRISAVSVEGKTVRAHVEVDGLPASLGVRKADVFVVAALDQAESQVLRGENKGRDLKHVAVVLSLSKVGRVDEVHGEGGGFSRDVTVKLPNAVEAGNLRVIAFVQKADSGEVIGASLLPAMGAKAEAASKGE